jgi:hypothetical protein
MEFINILYVGQQAVRFIPQHSTLGLTNTIFLNILEQFRLFSEILLNFFNFFNFYPRVHEACTVRVIDICSWQKPFLSTLNIS